MTKMETQKLLSMISEYWPNAPQASLARAELWHQELAELPLPLACQAVRKLARAGGPFAPGIADVIRAVLSLVRKEPCLTAAEAWNLILQAAEEYGSWHIEEAKALLPSAIGLISGIV